MKSGFEFKSISKSYENLTAVSDISFTIERGERVAMLGASGCGKSTILKLLAGLEPPTAGQIFLDGVVVSDTQRVLLPPHRRGVAMVFQDLALWPNLSVLENVLLGLTARKLPKKDARKAAMDALVLCRIEHLASRKPEKTSGGEQQRVALARAIASEPDFLLLDEPFSGLDLITKTELLRDISALVERTKMALVLVSHDPGEAITLCKSVIVLHEGKVEEQGDFAALLEAPHSPILQLYKAQSNRGMY